jgi:hypothetical protein
MLPRRGGVMKKAVISFLIIISPVLIWSVFVSIQWLQKDDITRGGIVNAVAPTTKILLELDKDEAVRLFESIDSSVLVDFSPLSTRNDLFESGYNIEIVFFSDRLNKRLTVYVTRPPSLGGKGLIKVNGKVRKDSSEFFSVLDDIRKQHDFDLSENAAPILVTHLSEYMKVKEGLNRHSR